MQMILIKTVVADFNGVTFFNPLQTFTNDLLDLFVEQQFSVLYRDLDVIVALGDIMIPMPNWCIDICHNTSIVPLTRLRAQGDIPLRTPLRGRLRQRPQCEIVI